MFKSRYTEYEDQDETSAASAAPTGVSAADDTVETIVGPSVEVEGDFNSKGNMVVQGTVAGNVRTEKNLRVERGARILANVFAQNAKISGEIRGNIKASDTLELTPTAVVVGDVEASTLIIAAGAILHGKCMMPGSHVTDAKASTKSSRARTRQTGDVDAEAAA
ncbi:MAG: polymer-forming cytoskeletal protein [Patescibacteria group bacterium]